MTISASLRRIYELLKPFRGVVAIIALALFVTQILQLGSTYALGKIVNAYSTHSEIWIVVRWACLMLVFFVIKNYLATKREDLEIKRFENAVPIYLSEFTMERLFTWSVAQHRRQNSGVSQS